MQHNEEKKDYRCSYCKEQGYSSCTVCEDAVDAADIKAVGGFEEKKEDWEERLDFNFYGNDGVIRVTIDGKEIPNIVELKVFIHSTLQELVKAIVERKEPAFYVDGKPGDGIVLVEDILSVAKEQFGVELPE